MNKDKSQEAVEILHTKVFYFIFLSQSSMIFSCIMITNLVDTLQIISISPHEFFMDQFCNSYRIL